MEANAASLFTGMVKTKQIRCPTMVKSNQCRYKKCWYAHPDDSSWATAKTEDPWLAEMERRSPIRKGPGRGQFGPSRSRSPSRDYHNYHPRRALTPPLPQPMHDSMLATTMAPPPQTHISAADNSVSETVKSFSKASFAQNEVDKIQEEFDFLNRISLEHFDEQQRAVVQKRLKELDALLKAKKQALESLLSRLNVQAIQGPAQPRGTSSSANNAVSADTVEFLATMKKEIYQLKTFLNQNPTLQKDDDAMDVDNATGVPSRSLKRRREPSADPIDTGAEWNVVKERIDKLEGDISDLRNQLHDQEGDTMDELKDIVRYEVEAAQAKQNIPALRNAKKLAAIEAEFDEAKKEHAKSETDLDGLTREIIEMVATAAVNDTEKSAQAQKRSELEAVQKSILSRLEADKQERERGKKELQALKAAVTMYTQRPRSPAAAPIILPPEYIMNLLQQNGLLQSVSSIVEPQVETLRKELDEKISTQASKMKTEIDSNVSLTNTMLETIYNRLGVPPTDT